MIIVNVNLQYGDNMEKWDLVDKDGRICGIQVMRNERHLIPPDLFHPCVEVWVKVGNKLLITRRHPDKSFGLKYDCPGGAVLSGEEIVDGAVRELFEETGILIDKGELSLLGYTASHPVFAASYLLCFDDLPKLSLQPTEVVGYKLVCADEIRGMMDELTSGTYKRFLSYEDIIFPKGQ